MYNIKSIEIYCLARRSVIESIRHEISSRKIAIKSYVSTVRLLYVTRHCSYVHILGHASRSFKNLEAK